MPDEQNIAVATEEDDDFTYEPAAAEPPPQVSSTIAIIRIVSVLGMGLCISFGLFLTLVGLRGVLIGVPLILLSIPCYFGMQLAERLATREERRSAETAAGNPR